MSQQVNAHEKLERAHRIIIDTYFAQKNEEIAFKMEKYLRALKMLIIRDGLVQFHDEVARIFFDATTEERFNSIKNIFVQSFGALNGPELNRQFMTLFKAKHSQTDKTTGFDDIFEAQFASFITGLSGTSNVMPIKAKELQTGQNQGTVLINMQEVTDDMVNQITKGYFKKVNENLQIAFKSSSSPVFTQPELRAIKTDIDTSTLKVTAKPNTFLHEMQTLFFGHRYSLKNYASLFWYDLEGNRLDKPRYSTIDIHLGDTNLFKGLYGPLSRVYDATEALRIIYSGTQRLVNQSKGADQIAKHFFHMRFIFELTGLGLYIKQNNTFSLLEPVDFLIVNDPATDNIYVRSTSQIIHNIIDNEQVSQKNFFPATIKLSRQYFNHY